MNELILSHEKENELVENLLTILSRECEFKLPSGLLAEEKRWFLNTLMCVRAVGELDESFLFMQNQLLTSEREREQTIDATSLKFKKGVAVTDVLPTKIKADVLVTLSETLLCGSAGNVKDLDSQILLKGGLQINEALSSLYKENNCINNYSQPYIVGGFNLPIGFIAKLLVPYVESEPSVDVVLKLKNNILNFVDVAKEKGVKTVVVNLSSAPKRCEYLLTVLENEIVNLIKKKKVKIKLIFYKNK